MKLILCLCLLSLSVHGGEKKQLSAKELLLKLGELERKDMIETCKRRITAARQNENRNIAEQQISHITATIKDLERQKGMYFPTLMFSDDSIGVLRRTLPVKVVQVIDATSMLVTMDSTTVWIDNYSTKNIVDEQELLIPDDAVFEYAGTKRYQTALGATSTVINIKRLDLSVDK